MIIENKNCKRILANLNERSTILDAWNEFEPTNDIVYLM